MPIVCWGSQRSQKGLNDMGGIELAYSTAYSQNPDLVVAFDPLSALGFLGLLGLGFYLVGRL